MFISIVLAIGQIELGERTIGGHFVKNMGSGSRWAGQQLLKKKWLAGIRLPDFLMKWLEPDRKATDESHSENLNEGNENISKADREAMLKLLKE